MVTSLALCPCGSESAWLFPTWVSLGFTVHRPSHGLNAVVAMGADHREPVSLPPSLTSKLGVGKHLQEAEHWPSSSFQSGQRRATWAVASKPSSGLHGQAHIPTQAGPVAGSCFCGTQSDIPAWGLNSQLTLRCLLRLGSWEAGRALLADFSAWLSGRRPHFPARCQVRTALSICIRPVSIQESISINSQVVLPSTRSAGKSLPDFDILPQQEPALFKDSID